MNQIYYLTIHVIFMSTEVASQVIFSAKISLRKKKAPMANIIVDITQRVRNL